MAILLNADSDRVNWGDITQFDGLSTVSFSFWARLDSIANTAVGRRWISKWGNVVDGLSFLIGQVDGDGNDIVLGISTDGSTTGGFAAFASTSNILGTGTWDHYFTSWTAPTAFTLFKNNVSISLTSLATVGVPVSIFGSATPFTYGADGAASPLNGILGSLAEVGAWNRVLDANERTMLSLGYAPSFINRSLIHYADCVRDVNDRRQGGSRPTLTSVDADPHPRIIYPRSAKTYRRTSAAAPAQNVFIQEHIGRGIGRGVLIGR